jgi:putative membrane protein
MWWGVWGVGMMLFMLLFWALLIAGVIVLVRWVFGRSGLGGRPERGDRAREILKERYAKGELTREQFQSMHRELEN